MSTEPRVNSTWATQAEWAVDEDLGSNHLSWAALSQGEVNVKLQLPMFLFDAYILHCNSPSWVLCL